MRRFYIDTIRPDNGNCVIQGSEARHMSKVLRMKPGDRLILMDSHGLRYISRIESGSSRQVRVLLEEPLPAPPLRPWKITLCQAVSKSQAMDYVIQKTSELGVDRIVPFISDRSVVRLEPHRLPNKMRHWNEIAISSAKQCGRAIPAKIEAPLPFSDLMKEGGQRQTAKVILWEAEESVGLSRVLKGAPAAGEFVAVIGPEGGFTGDEIAMAKQAGFVSVSLGSRILRSETAATALVAIAQYELGDLGLADME